MEAWDRQLKQDQLEYAGASDIPKETAELDDLANKGKFGMMNGAKIDFLSFLGRTKACCND